MAETVADKVPLCGFVLSQHYHQGRQGIDLEFWLSTAIGPVRYRVSEQESVFFIARSALPQTQQLLCDIGHWRYAELELKTFAEETAVAIYFSDIAAQRQALALLETAGIGTHEEDIRPPERFLMERFIQGGVAIYGTPLQRQGYWELQQGQLRAADYLPRLTLLSVDIETSMQGHELYSIGLSLETADSQRVDRVLMRGEGEDTDLVEFLADEPRLLRRFIDLVNELDPDLLVGWSVINFDFNFLQRKAEQFRIPLKLGRGGARLHLRDHNNMTFASLPGRVIVDGIDCLKGATYHFDSYSLENVSRQLLDRGKIIHDVANRGEEIAHLFANDKLALAAYNIEDCRLVLDIFQQADLLHYLLARAQMTGLLLDKVGGSAQAFDNLYLPRLHRQGYVAPVYASGASGLDSPGGYVMDSRPGLYDHVLVLDFKSLYPSIILTFLIDPLGLVEGLKADEKARIPGFNQAHFHRVQHILPALLKSLWQQRDQAKAQQNKSLQQAIKIIMNSFYGVLGSPVCRFFDQRLSGSITLRGHQILKESRDFIEAQGLPVIYGDTDSVFVWATQANTDEQAEKLGAQLAAQLNHWWTTRIEQEFGLTSQLEIEYETHYRRFLMPTIRGSEKGSKKRYAGLVAADDGDALIFKGLESVRSDWTPLARQFQQQLYTRVFHDQPFSDYICQLVLDLYDGKLDQQLVYHKRLRQSLAAYTKAQPPHVRAARRAEAIYKQQGLPARYRRGDSIPYVITMAGPEPAEFLQSTIDYDHYLERQLRPVAEGILPFIGVDFDGLISRQSSLF